jgi:hypothetical protein
MPGGQWAGRDRAVVGDEFLAEVAAVLGGWYENLIGLFLVEACFPSAAWELGFKVPLFG